MREIFMIILCVAINVLLLCAIAFLIIASIKSGIPIFQMKSVGKMTLLALILIGAIFDIILIICTYRICSR